MLAGGLAAHARGMALADNQWVGLAYYLLAFLPVGWDVLREAAEGIGHGDFFTEHTLMSLAAIGAFCIGEYPEAVAVVLLYQVGEYLQEKAVGHARGHIASLAALRPDRARRVVEDNGKESRELCRPEDLGIGETVEVKVGERVPVDGVLLTEASPFDTAALTGESLPRVIGKGDEVLAGMCPSGHVVRIRTSRPASDSAVARVLHMVEEASARKAPAELAIRRFARIYTPVVFALALLVVLVPWLSGWLLSGSSFSFSEWLHRALVFLVISCPCALVISVPLSYFAGIGVASRRGILFKGSNCLDAVTGLDAVAFDKTGTLTTDVFSVSSTRGLNPMEQQAVAAVEAYSSHPVAKAIVEHVKWMGLSASLPVDSVEEMAGFGMKADVEGHEWTIGTLRLMEREGIVFPVQLREEPCTLVACARNGVYVGCILLNTALKPDAQEAVGSLRELGIAHTAVFSGDKQELVADVARQLGIDEYAGDLLPGDKVGRVETMQQQGRKVAFVGDGINDAPVLAMSDVGFAMGALGSDVAVEAADVVIRSDQPSKVAEAIAIGRSTRRTVKQNIAFAIGVKAVVMVLGVCGLANMWEAVFADTGVALLAVIHATRPLLAGNK